jgi:hypothetical protein
VERRDGVSRYVIEINPEYEDKIRGVMILGAENSNLYLESMAVDELEELNSDYINEHYGELQDTAYQRGLNDAWEAARKISLMSPNEIEKVFPGAAKYNRYNLGYSGVEAIEKLKAYEEKQKAADDIKVGDEVISLKRNGEVIEDMSPWIVTYETKYSYQGFEADGMSRKNPKDSVRKTGRHFDIQKILEEMRR